MKICILGAGESGTGAALLAKLLGHDVFVSDKGPIAPSYKDQLTNEGIQYEEGTHSEERILQHELIIKSPGIPDKAPLIVAAKAKAIEIIDEIEFAFRNKRKGKIIAVTGSNGKTTTTRMLQILTANLPNVKVATGGNIGTSFASILYNEFKNEQSSDFYMLEVSSFQLDGCYKFRPDVSIITNITPDHLDRYDYKFENYVASKFRIAQAQTDYNHFIYNADDQVVTDYVTQHFERSKTPMPFAISLKDIDKGDSLDLEMFVCPKASLKIKGKHNFMNAAMAVRALLLSGFKKEEILPRLQAFTPDAHRMEPVATVNGVEYINDSKATNVDSVWYALDAIETPLIWIAGGTDKGNDYTTLLPLVKGRIRALICMTTDDAKLRSVFAEHIPLIETVGSAKEAVEKAAALGREGDTVLLSPACASFDLFKNYLDRGDQFKAAVTDLKGSDS
jgi:UDP-N-acetylmuramoylalanine--D-glutamate ligase